VSSSLREMLVDAQRQGRLTCGIYDSGTLLAKYVLVAHIIIIHQLSKCNFSHEWNNSVCGTALLCIAVARIQITETGNPYYMY